MSYLDKVAICPYNSNHIFAKEKLFPHLQRCKDKIKSKKPTLFCKNDSSLRFLEENKQDHYTNCKYCASRSNIINIHQNNISSDDLYQKPTELNMRNIRLNNLQNENISQSIHLDLDISEMSQVTSRFEYTQKDLKDFDINNESYFMDPNDWVDLAQEIKENTKEDKTILY